MPWATARAPRTALRRAARALGVVVGVAPQLERDGRPRARRALRAARRRPSRRRRSSPRACARVGRRRRRRRRPPRRARACSASAASSAAWSLPGLSPPSASEIACMPTRAASSSARPRTSSTAAPPAARAAPQPDASKPASATRSPSTATPMRTRSPHAAPPAAPVHAPGHAAAADRVAQVLLEALVGHPASVGRAVRRSAVGVAAADAQLLGCRDGGVVAVVLELREGEEDVAGAAPAFSCAGRRRSTCCLGGEGDQRRLELALAGVVASTLARRLRAAAPPGGDAERLGQRRHGRRRVDLLVEA